PGTVIQPLRDLAGGRIDYEAGTVKLVLHYQVGKAVFQDKIRRLVVLDVDEAADSVASAVQLGRDLSPVQPYEPLHEGTSHDLSDAALLAIEDVVGLNSVGKSYCNQVAECVIRIADHAPVLRLAGEITVRVIGVRQVPRSKQAVLCVVHGRRGRRALQR